MNELSPVDRRRRRTRDAIHGAFVELATSRRYDDFGVAELIATAGIGKSTFYEHYKGKDDVLRALMDGMLAELADATAGRVAADRLKGLAEHFWENRRLGKSVFGGALAPAIRRRLAELTETALQQNGSADDRAARMRAAYAAAGQVGLLSAWFAGEISGDPESIAKTLCGFR